MNLQEISDRPEKKHWQLYLWPVSKLQGRQDKYLTLETYVDGEGDFGGSKDESGTFTDLQEKSEQVISTIIIGKRLSYEKRPRKKKRLRDVRERRMRCTYTGRL